MHRVVTVMLVARRRLGLSQAALAAMIGVTQPRISSWETRQAPIPPARLEQLARILEVDSGNLQRDA